jgi:hypothetical protein
LYHAKYNILRRDKKSDGNSSGGIVIYILRKYTVLFTKIFDNIEAIYFKLAINNFYLCLLCCYKNPKENSYKFLDTIDEYLITTDLATPLFLIGDFNIDFNKINSKNILAEFMNGLNLYNLIKKSTRTASRYYQKSNKIIESNTIIDLVLYNIDLKLKYDLIDCPFSDHKFVLVSLSLPDRTKHVKAPVQIISSRKLNPTKLELISKQFDSSKINVELQNHGLSSTEMWLALKSSILEILNRIAPVVKINITTYNTKFPWLDIELKNSKDLRDKLYKKSKINHDKNSDIFKQFVLQKKHYQDLSDKKMIEYFKDKTISDFKNSKKFFKFYSTYYKLKSDKHNEILPNSISNGTETVSGSS